MRILFEEVSLLYFLISLYMHFHMTIYKVKSVIKIIKSNEFEQKISIQILVL